MSGTIELYAWATPNSWKVAIALEEMALPYVLRPVAIVKGEQFKPDFLELSPNDRIPAICDPDGPDGGPISLFESGAILQYLGRKTNRFYPTDERSRAEVDQWLFWQMAGVGPMYGQATHFLVYAPAMVNDPREIEYGARRYSNEVNRLLGVLERRLDGRAFIAGDYSIADMASYPWVNLSSMLGQELGVFPNVAAWLERMQQRPAVKRGMAATEGLGGPPPIKGTEEHRVFSQSLF